MPKRDIKTYNVIQQTARVDDDVIEKMGIDVKAVTSNAPSNPGLSKEVYEEGDYYCFCDVYGVLWKMPKIGGFYYDMVEQPFKNEVDVQAVASYPWTDMNDPIIYKDMKAKADLFTYEQEKAYCLERPYGGIWETALWVCGFESMYCNMMIEKDFAHALMKKITELRMQYWKNAVEQVKDSILIVSEADDVASQNGLLCSMELYKEMVHPYHKKLFSYIKSLSKEKIYINYHTCGAAKEMLPLLIEEGVDIINPVQISAKGMNTKELKKEFGNDLVFWGGGIDTQYVLQNGTKQEIYDEVKRRIDDLAPGGGFVFSAVHNIQANVPPENVAYMWEAL